MVGLFALMCLIWGATWLAMKLGVASQVAPIFFGGTRFVVAGLALLLVAGLRGEARRLDQAEIGRLVLIQLLMVVLTYAPLFWAMLYVPSGLTAVLDLALMPVSLLTFGILLGEERWTFGRAAALGIGFSGLLILFGPQIAAPTAPLALLGAAAIVFSAVVYSLGSVIARPLTKAISAAYLSGLTLLPGGVGRLAVPRGVRLADRLYSLPSADRGLGSGAGRQLRLRLAGDRRAARRAVAGRTARDPGRHRYGIAARRRLLLASGSRIRAALTCLFATQSDAIDGSSRLVASTATSLVNRCRSGAIHRIRFRFRALCSPGGSLGANS